MRRVTYCLDIWNTEARKYIKEEQPGTALFHSFGYDVVENNSGFATLSTAIIELEDGSVKNIPVENIKFLPEDAAPKTGGMYEVNNPDHPKVKVGKYTICRHSEYSVWIQNDQDEGAQFYDEGFEHCIAKFWKDNF